MTLHEYLQLPRPGPFVRGRTDCAAFVARWMEQVMGAPLRAAFLGGTLTPAGLRRYIFQGGGLLRTSRRILIAHGWKRSAEPTDGDVVIAAFPESYQRVLFGIWSAGYVVTIDAGAQLRIVRPDQLLNLHTWRYHGN